MFVNESTNREVYDYTNQVYASTDALELELTDGFKHYLSLPKNDEKAILIFGILCSIGGLFLHGLIAYFYKHEGFYTLWVTVALLFALIEGNAEESHSSCPPALSPS